MAITSDWCEKYRCDNISLRKQVIEDFLPNIIADPKFGFSKNSFLD